MSLGILAGVVAAFYGYAVKEYYQGLSIGASDFSDLLDFRFPLFVISGLIFGTIISGTYFSDLGQKPKAIFELLIPASRIEKFLTALFYSVPVAIVSFILVFLVIDYGFVTYFRDRGHSVTSWISEATGEEFKRDNWAYFCKMEINEKMKYFYFLPLLFNALFLLGSIGFRNFQYVKTAILLVIYVAFWFFCVVYLAKFLTAGTISVKYGNYPADEFTILKYVCLSGIVVTLLVWGIGFLKLKEKEV
ncbi:hypothetical protein [Sphingobacterium sp. LRF_L2]|uniref:hypothetical protein n=1 Tax=Sphingobacterium sp. LRF_L2 TaxID=3369421 RepID=UPI003F5EDF9B